MKETYRFKIGWNGIAAFAIFILVAKLNGMNNEGIPLMTFVTLLLMGKLEKHSN